MALQSLSDIILNGEEYQIDMGSYRVRDIVDFAPRAAEPGGSIIHSELGLYQPFLQTDFRHGFGFPWHQDAEGYMSSTGNIDTRHAGIAMMMTAAVNDSDAFHAQGFITIRDYMSPSDTTATTDYTLAWSSDELRKRTVAGVWSSEIGLGADTTAGFTNVNFVLETQNYVHVCSNGARLVTITKSDGAVTAGGVNVSASDYKWMIAHEGYIYAGKDGTSLIFRDSNENLSQLAGDVADDPNAVTMAGNFPTIGAIVAFGKLFVTRQDGLFQVGDDLIARRVLDFSSEISRSNFLSVALFNNRIIFPIRDTLYSWNGATLADITPPFLTDTFPYITYGRFDNFVPALGYLFFTARTSEATYQEHILCWDGVGFHNLAQPVTNGTDTISGMGYDGVNNYLWYSVDATADTKHYIEFKNQSEFPYENFPTTGTHALETSRLDMGFRRVTKSTPSMFVEANNCNSSDYISVYYSLDGAAFTEWGGAGNGRIDSDGITELVGPISGTTDQTIEYNYLQLQFRFVTSQSTGSPILEGYTLRFIMRPNTLYGHSFNVVAAKDLKTGAGARQLKSVRDIYSQLETARASAAPVTFVDPFGVEHRVYISALERRAVERHGFAEREGFPDIESVVQVNVVELG